MFEPPLLLQYLYKQFVLAGGLDDPTLSTLRDCDAPECDKHYFTTMIEMFDRSMQVLWGR